MLDTLFLERWDVLLDAIRETDAPDVPAEQKLTAIAGFIIDSYRHDPDLMKVIIVEVTRAANTFGATHIGKIGEAYALIRGVVEKAQETGEFRSEIPPDSRSMAFYGAIEQVLTGWIFGLLAESERAYELAKAHIVRTICGGLAALDSRRHDRQRSRQAPGLVRPARRHRRPGLDRDDPHRGRGIPPHLWGRSARVKTTTPSAPRSGARLERAVGPGTPAQQGEAAAGATRRRPPRPPRPARPRRRPSARTPRRAAPSCARSCARPTRAAPRRRPPRPTTRSEAAQRGGEALAQGAQGAREARSARPRPRPPSTRAGRHAERRRPSRQRRRSRRPRTCPVRT